MNGYYSIYQFRGRQHNENFDAEATYLTVTKKKTFTLKQEILPPRTDY